MALASELFRKLIVNRFNGAAETGGIRAGDRFAVQELRDGRLQVLDLVRIRGELEVVDSPPVQKPAVSVEQITARCLL